MYSLQRKLILKEPCCPEDQRFISRITHAHNNVCEKPTVKNISNEQT